MFKKYVQITAIFNFPIAIGIMIPELIFPKPSSFIITLVLTSFLMCIGAALLWAVSDLPKRAPTIVWNGFGMVLCDSLASLLLPIPQCWTWLQPHLSRFH